MNQFITWEDLNYHGPNDDYIIIHDENEIILNINHKLYEHKFIRIDSKTYYRTAFSNASLAQILTTGNITGGTSADTIKCIYCNYECILFIGLCKRKENLWSLFTISNDKIEAVNVADCISDDEKIIKSLIE